WAIDEAGNINTSSRNVTIAITPSYCDVDILSLPFTIDQSNTYYCVAKNFTIDGQTGIQFQGGVQNSTLDGLDHTIESNKTTSTYGVHVLGSTIKNNTFKNLYVRYFYHGICIQQSDDNTITNITVYNNTNRGIDICSGSDYNNLTYITAYNNTGAGIACVSGPHDNLFTHIVAYENGDGFNFYNAAGNNTLIDVTTHGNSDYGIDLGSGGNNNTLINITIYNNNNGVRIGGSNHTLINITAYNNSGGFGIRYCYNSSLTNITSENNTNSGFSLYNSSSNNFIDVKTRQNQYGFRIYGNSDNNTINNSVIQDNTVAGIYFNLGGSDHPEYNKIYNCLLNNSGTNGNIRTYSSMLANYFNTTNQTGTRIYSEGTQIGGNYYTNSAGNDYSDTCTDADYDGFCDKVYDVYNDTWCEPGVNCSDNVDYLPLKSDEVPYIIWENPTPPDGNVTSDNYVYLNTTIKDVSNTSAFFDWNYSLVGWWRMDDVNQTGEGALVYDISSYGNNGTAYGNAVQDNSGKLGKGFDFDGNVDRITIPNDDSLNISGPMTLVAWIYTDSQIDGWRNYISRWAHGADNLNPQNAWYVAEQVSGSGHYIKFAMEDDTGQNITTGNTILALNTWYHVAAIYNGSHMLIYVNGSLDNTPTARSTGARGNANTEIDIGGKQANPLYGHAGLMDDVMIFNRSLSAKEIVALYTNTSSKYLEHNFTNLTDGYYDYIVYAQDLTGNMNSSSRNVTVDKPPKYWDNSINSTLKGEPVEFRLRWTDNIGLSGYTFSFCNGTWNGTHCIGDISLWPNSTFTKCKNISISNVGSSTLENFPAYINLTKDGDMLSDYSDLRFFNSSCNSGGNELDYEVENYTTGNAHIWVRIPSLPSSGKTISVYYSNNTPVESGENKTGVWNSGYKMVQHMQVISGSINDSTSNDNDGSLSSAPYNVPGTVGNAIQFDGIDDAIDIPYSSTLEPINLTYEVWGRITGMNSDSGTDALFGSKRGKDHYNNNDGMQFTVQAYMDIGQRKYRALYERDTISPQQHMLGSAEGENNTWYHFTTTFDEASDTAEFYINASLNATESGMESEIIWYNDNTVGFVFGRIDRPTPRYYNCTIDEVRISDVIRSSDWINQTYQMVQNQGSFVTFGSEESSTGWKNDTWTQMTGLGNWSNVTKVVNSTVGATIAWKVYANDTVDNWNISDVYSFVTVDFFELTGKVLFWENATCVSGAYVIAKVYDGLQFLGQGSDTTDSSGDYLIKIPLTLEEDKRYLANITVTKGSYQAYLKHYFRL
ncbi:MAG: DUF2341 domain-containing protein, partial [Candidatus Aenigmarchaeota archaeon]|nr:DUF2341 domain-containing protein [Candidatus Aenigmarchaeota archaeon]